MLSSKGAAHMPWVEKYRPQTLKDVVGNVDAVSRLQRIAEDGNMPHMILTVHLPRPFSRRHDGQPFLQPADLPQLRYALCSYTTSSSRHLVSGRSRMFP